jgi:two-component system nitrate/nitrite response regulator NarL
MSPHIPTFVIDQSSLIREGLIRILSGTRFRISAACSDFPEISKKAAHAGNILVLLGSSAHPDEDFAELRRFKLQHEHAKIIVLSEACSPQQLLSAISAGAGGFLSKQISRDALLNSLDLVWIGGTVIPSSCLRRLIGHDEPTIPEIAPTSPAPDLHELMIASPTLCEMNLERLHRLSCKEQLILRCLTQGASNKSIARELNMAEATVKVHIKGILRKIRVSNRTQAAVWALNRDPRAAEDEGPRSSVVAVPNCIQTRPF